MADPRQSPALSEAQLEIMNVFWDAAPRSVADVWAVVGDRRGVARNTVHTLIVRLEEKGWLRRRESGNRVAYVPVVSRADYQHQTVRRTVATVFDGSASGLVLALLQDHSLSDAEANRIRTMIAAARREKS